MEKDERREFIKARFKALEPSNATPLPKAKQRPAEQRGPQAGRMAYGGFGFALAWRWGRTEWLQTPDSPKDPYKLRLPRGGAEPSPLARIAQKMPGKLKRL
jgi:hypothetical protein